MTRQWQRWAPAIVAPALIVAVAIAVPISANAAADLPDKTAQEVLELAAASDTTALTGTIAQSSELGLPDLSVLGTSGGDSDALSSAMELLTGSHSAVVYLDGPTKARIQVLDSLAERNAIRNGDDLWLYDSEESTAVHAQLPAYDPSEKAPDAGEIPTPAALAEHMLDGLDPTTDVSVGDDRRVAGRLAYDLILTPRSDDTLVGTVSIAVDGESGLPLSVEVTARGQSEPAFSLAFTELTLEAPPEGTFDWAPPAGATVTEQPLPDPSARTHDGAIPEPTVVGETWDSVIVLPASPSAEAGPGSGIDTSLLDQLSSPVAGGRIVESSLVTALLLDDGRILVGAVTPERLQAVAAGL